MIITNQDLGMSNRGGIAIVTEKRRRTSNIMIARYTLRLIFFCLICLAFACLKVSLYS